MSVQDQGEPRLVNGNASLVPYIDTGLVIPPGYYDYLFFPPHKVEDVKSWCVLVMEENLKILDLT